MANAPYEVNVTGTDDETYAFSVPFENADGSAFPFSDFEIEYSVAQCGSPVLSMKLGSGITVIDGVVTFKAPRGSLKVGEYQHGCRIRHVSTGDEVQVFDGCVTIGEGNF